MSILGNIMSSILGGRGRAAPPLAAASTPKQGRAGAQVAASQPPSPAPAQSTPQGHPETPPSGPMPPQVDVAAVLDGRAEETAEELNWRTSIVDLMKLLKLDSSLPARKTLARELRYTGDTKDTAAMNAWLHTQVMAKLVQGGGKLPSDVKH